MIGLAGHRDDVPAGWRMKIGLGPDEVALHQLLTLVPDAGAWAERLAASPLFSVAAVDGGTVAHWMQLSPEHDPAGFPLGRVTLGGFGVLLEAFSEPRLQELVRRVEETGTGRITRDQVRVIPVADAVSEPNHVLQPLQDSRGDALTRREIAAMYLRMAWPFLESEEFGGRRPEAVLHSRGTGESLDSILEGLAPKLRERIPTFPAFAGDELRDLLTAAPPIPSPSRSAPAGEPRKD
ncbi:MAG: hypothetical protein HKN12_01370 [Gemmatimonadetes bacterium]|nr:hypothetical protein [Gemmatimonadota bacterium]